MRSRRPLDLHARFRRRRRAERAVALPLTAMASLLLVLSAAIAVDATGWWVRANQVQRAADNAALAGVVWLPDLRRATSEAKRVAALNGFSSGSGATVAVTRAGRYKLKVVITTRGRLYFGRAFVRNPSLSRSAISQQTLPVPLGSPESAMGTNDQAIGSFAPQKYWLAISGWCMGREQGDLLSAGFQANDETCPPDQPTTTRNNPDYAATGYTFVVEVQPSSPAIDVQVYDPGECFLTPDIGYGLAGPTYFDMYAADDTPFDDTDNPLIASATIQNTDVCDAWAPLLTIPAGAHEGQWLIRAYTKASDLSSGLNRFGLWAKRSSDTQPCSTMTDSTCPGLHARDYLPMLVYGASDPTFYLAEIAPEQADKEMVVSLFDSAEGMYSLELLTPDGTPVDFTYATADGDYGPSPADSCATGPCLRVDGTGPPLVPGQRGVNYPNGDQDKYNNREVQLHVRLPSRSVLQSYTNDWWRLRYTPRNGALATDRTTWGVAIKGDPVKLVS